MEQLFLYSTTDFIILIIISYLCGSIPFGLLISKSFGLDDLRTKGSGNIGATNAWRVGGKKIGLLTFFCDAMKCFLPTIVFKHLFDVNLGALSGLIAIIGHMFPIWLKFKGGKGVSSMFGLLFAATPVIAVFTSLSWLLIFKKTRLVSLASLTSMLFAAITSYFLIDLFVFIIYLLIALLIVITHRSNINRLINNKENKI